MTPLYIITMTSLKRTDFKPIDYDFDGTTEQLLENFFKKVKAAEGVVKYHMTKWSSFPVDLETSKNLAKDWAKKFTLNSKYKGFVINIYFHTDKKTIRFQVKKYVTLQLNVSKIDEEIINNDSCVNIIKTKLESEEIIPSINTFVFENWETFPSLAECKELGKSWSIFLEESDKFKNFKVIIFLNPSASSVKITINNK